MNKFESLGVNSLVLKAISELGFETPTPIQEKVLPELLNGHRDLVALAQTGTGKTAAFGLPLAQLVNFNSKETQALILCPTRELCMQITRDLKSYTKFLQGANIVAIYGGASIETQTREIRKGAQIIVATPGRMVDMIDRKRVQLGKVSYVVLDEADEMLNMGFQEDLTTILSQTPGEKSTWLFSATMPNEVSRIAKKYMENPFEITVGNKNQGAENIEHLYYVVHARDKYKALKRIADFNPEIFAIVFCRTKMETQEVADWLIRDGYNADALHGDLSQAQRDHVMKRYRSRALQMLVATDVAARGIDVDDVTHVINYNLPDEAENYTHRSGRTARAGKSGVSIAIINTKEIGKIRMIERIIGKKFSKATIPVGFDVCEKQLFHLVNKVHNIEVNEQEISKYLPKIYEELKDLSKEELIKRFISEEFNRFLSYYKNAPDLNAEGGGHQEHGGANRGNIQRLFISLGRLDGLFEEELRTYINEKAGLGQPGATMVDVKNSFSFFSVDQKEVEKVQAAFQNELYNDRPVKIELSSGGGGFRGGEGRFGKKFKYGGGGGGGYAGKKKFKSYGNKEEGGGNGGRNKYKSYGKQEEGGGGGGNGDRNKYKSFGQQDDSGGRKDRFKKERGFNKKRR